MSIDLLEYITNSQAIIDEAKELELDKEMKSLPRVFTKLSELAGNYPSLNLAVEVCCRMFQVKVEEYLGKGSKPSVAREAGCLGYRSCMPKLSGPDNIRDFIACVAHGMSTGIIPCSEGTRLLYAAQVAHSAFPKRKNLMKMLKKSDKKKAATSAASTTSAGKPQKNTHPSPLSHPESSPSQNPGVKSLPADGS